MVSFLEVLLSILDIPYQIHDCQMFSPILWIAVYSIDCVFWCKHFFHEPQIFCFSFCLSVIGVLHTYTRTHTHINHCQMQCCEAFLLGFLLRFFSVKFSLRSWFHFELIFVYGFRYISNFTIFVWRYTTCPASFVKEKTVLSPMNILRTLVKNHLINMLRFISGFSILSHCYNVCLSLCQYHTVLATIALQ